MQTTDQLSPLEAARLALGKTIVEVAEEAGISRTFYHYILSGKRYPSEKVRRRLAATLQIPVGMIPRKQPRTHQNRTQESNP